MAGKILGLCVGFVPIMANAGWMKTDLPDEMRGTSAAMYSQEASPVRGEGPSLDLRVFDKGDGAPGVMLELKSATADDCPSREEGKQTCNLQVRFENGAVQSVSFASKDGKSFIPTSMGAFSGAVINAKFLYVEIPVDKFNLQYRFDLTGIDVEYKPGPSISILGFEIGSAYPGRKPDLPVSSEARGDICYSGEQLQGVFKGVVVAKATLCFYNDVFYQALVVPGTKASYTAGFKFLTEKFGKTDPDGIYPSWPDEGDKLITRNVREASYFSVGKIRYDYPFIISDEAWSLMVPKREEQSRLDARCAISKDRK
ncbi:hypothetical protein KMS_R33680 [Pseudomonas sp. LRP2-20]|uniref:hypothetical protein n=1 Tax=Pseudomonas sp. LRP2-20 TaxID=2944234 RepID=UPI002186F29E|nr:hypothetical protein [Pseudomonas sp. LRP2-20]BDM23611.1 hypothetical protein KMS_R33680 [Pseudomonas sp. LRP2-20]